MTDAKQYQAETAALETLSHFELRASTDIVKTDLELRCDECDEHLCDAEHDDTLSPLAGVAFDHWREKHES